MCIVYTSSRPFTSFQGATSSTGFGEPISSHVSFLSLPPELRNEVYRYLLTSAVNIGLAPGSARPELHFSIIYTNRQIAQEATAILYGENNFVALVTHEDRLFRVNEMGQGYWMGAGTMLQEERQVDGRFLTYVPPPGYIYRHALARIRYLRLRVEFSRGSRRTKFEPWNFQADQLAASLKKTVDPLASGTSLKGLTVWLRFPANVRIKRSPSLDEVVTALEPLRALKGVENVMMSGLNIDGEMLFLAKLIWDMMESWNDVD